MIPEVIEHPLQSEGVIGHLLFGLRHDVDGDEVIAALELHAVPRKIEQGIVAARNVRLESAQGFLHGFEREVLFQRDAETAGLERLGHGLGVGSGVAEHLRVLVAVVADDQRDAFGVGRKRTGGQHEAQCPERSRAPRRPSPPAPPDPPCNPSHDG